MHLYDANSQNIIVNGYAPEIQKLFNRAAATAQHEMYCSVNHNGCTYRARPQNDSGEFSFFETSTFYLTYYNQPVEKYVFSLINSPHYRDA
jgi:hypothetical protein